MHQPITIAKVRKATTIKVAAGDWIILVSPNEPFSNHAAKRSEVMSKSRGMINEDISVLSVGRMDNKYVDLQFSTSEEKETAEKKLAEAQASISQIIEDSKQLQGKAEAEAKAKKEAEHKAKIEKLNAQHDAIRDGAATRIEQSRNK